MSKLNQIIAVTAGKKTRAKDAITKAYQMLQKKDLLDGITRTYKPKDEEGDRLPSEEKHVQLRVNDALKEVGQELCDLFDVVFTQDVANTVAKADIVVDGKTVAKQVPVTYLLFLEKQLIDLHTFVEKLPVLDAAETWQFSQEADAYACKPYESTRTKKIKRNHVKSEATEKHPAQVETYDEDVIVGTWRTVKFSGAVPAKQRNEMLDRVRKLQESVKFAREEANATEIKTVKIGESILDFVFGK
jgi:hypothetical protein